MSERSSNPMPMADAHNDLLLGVHHLQERGHRDPFGDFWLPQLEAGGVVLQILPIFTEEQFVGEGALRRTLLILETARQVAADHCDRVAIVETSQELSAVLDEGRIAFVLALEGAEPIGSDIAMIDTFWRLGIRVMSLTWNRRTIFADGTGERGTAGGLTTLGLEAVREMEQLGMVLDVSHLSDAGVAHVAEVAERPFVASHSSCRSLQGHPRNLTDDQIRIVAASGGFVGLNAFGPFLADEATSDSYLDHVGHAVDLIGADHVGLGPDFIADLIETVDPILGGALVDLDQLGIVPDLSRPADLAQLGRRLIDRFDQEVAAQVAAGTMVETLGRLLPT